MKLRWKLLALPGILKKEPKNGLLILVEPGKLGVFPNAPRVYYIISSEKSVRGGHYHPQGGKQEILICLQGEIEVKLHSQEACGSVMLSSPDKGVFIPCEVWHEVHMDPGAILLSLASTEFDFEESIEVLPFPCQCGKLTGE
ncbi:MAG TPA: FdtA/QdtA family cupin domain-containing protein [Patescibacteria group bacterium]|nr:FdtA/QdtA family cupin domain-containing protein [Patescibacteria group bacterium]